MLFGSWQVYCTLCGNFDQVDGVTAEHECEKCGKPSVIPGLARLRCPHCGNVDTVTGATHSHLCNACGKEMRLYSGG